MFNPLPPEPEGAARYGSASAFEYATKLIQNGASTATVRQKLLNMGLSEQHVENVLTDLAQSPPAGNGQAGDDPEFSAEELEKKMKSEAGQNQMVMGGFILIVGLAVTVGTYFLAQQSGTGIHVIAWGAIIGGGIMLLRGAQSAGTK